MVLVGTGVFVLLISHTAGVGIKDSLVVAGLGATFEEGVVFFVLHSAHTSASVDAAAY